jgi:hypothetical protein
MVLRNVGVLPQHNTASQYGGPLVLLSLAPQPSLGHGLLHKIGLNFLEASQQFSFLQDRVVSPTPNPHPGGSGLYIYIPQRQGGPVIPLGPHFSQLLRHAWVTVGLFLFPGHHTDAGPHFHENLESRSWIMFSGLVK